MDKKICCKCKQEKLVSEFYTDRSKSSGLMPRCMVCYEEARTVRRRAKGVAPAPVSTTDTERKCHRCREWRPLLEFAKDTKDAAGRGWICCHCSAAYQLERARVLGVKPRTVIRDGELKLCTKCKAWKPLSDFHKTTAPKEKDRHVRRCKVCTNAASKAYQAENRKSITQRATTYRRNNIQAHLASTLRSSVRYALRGRKKSACSLSLIGCTIEELKAHLEKQFKPGMSWVNHSVKGWHIDHIRPCASFDLTDPEQQKQCFHYTNLQPLWAGENYSKGDTYSEPDKQGQSPAPA